MPIFMGMILERHATVQIDVIYKAKFMGDIDDNEGKLVFDFQVI
jgi:hypothetical protein